MQETTKSDMDSGLTDETLTLLVANVGATGGWDPTRSGGAEFMKVTRYYNCTLVGGGGGGTLASAEWPTVGPSAPTARRLTS